ncbi:AI-2E family transporter [Atopobium deltae]|uniref:ATP synthase F0, A subunit n=1 Tax=Atopobium deltae TaxID=1393034 RepID=A0A133XUQ7_9ACTN|nr:AI-2E family transporter [Atopobium deltae]KXB34684.1 hypothetical protein HMPREF3192_00783 [Atopobium deltae]
MSTTTKSTDARVKSSNAASQNASAASQNGANATPASANNASPSSDSAAAQANRHLRVQRVGIRIWTIIGALVLLFVAFMILSKLWPAVQLLLWGGIIGFICSPVTNWLEDHKVPRGLAAFVSLGLVLGVIIFVLTLLLPPFIEEILNLLRAMPRYLYTLQGMFHSFMNQHQTIAGTDVQVIISQSVNSFSNVLSNSASELAGRLSGGIVTNIVGTLTDIFIMFLGLVAAYWFAKDYPTIVHELSVLAGPRHQESMTMFFAVMSRAMGGYMRGIVITAFFGGLLSYLGFTFIGHPYAGLMGITVGVLHFIPVIGPWIGASLAALLALFTNYHLAGFSLLASFVAQNLTDNLVSPLVMQSSVKVHPIMSLTAIMIGNALGGVLGMILAIPLSAAIKGIFVYGFERRTHRQLVSYNGALFKSTPFHDATGAILPSFDALDDDNFFEHSRLVPRVENLEVTPEAPPEDMLPTIADVVRKYNEQRTEPFFKVGVHHVTRVKRPAHDTNETDKHTSTEEHYDNV